MAKRFEIRPTDVLIIGGGLVAFTAIKKVLVTLGIAGGPGGKAVIDEIKNPNSVWKPAFWKTSPPGSWLITVGQAAAYSKTIHGAFGIFQDDFNAIFSVFSRLRTKSQVSFLCDQFSQIYGEDLLTFLTDGGGILPWDGLSDTHLKSITDMVDHLPQYTA